MADGPFCIRPVTVIVPATVPLIRTNCGGSMAVVLFAGNENVTVRPPVANCIAGSSDGATASGANEIVNEPESATGYAAESDNVNGTCCAGLTALGSPFDDNVPIGGPMVIGKARVLLTPAGSATRIVIVAEPVVFGVPCKTPAGVKTRPDGKTPLVTDHAYGLAPPDASSCCEYAK